MERIDRITSLRLTRETRKRLEAVKVHKREVLDDVIGRLLDAYERRETQSAGSRRKAS
jgi:predicted DNA-binding protein